MTTLIMKELLPEGGTEEELESIDVLNGITDVYPPVFCMTSVADHQKAQAPALVQKLMENNVPFVYRVFGDKVNKLGHVFHCDVKQLMLPSAMMQNVIFSGSFVSDSKIFM